MPTCKKCGKSSDEAEFYESISTYCKTHWKERVKNNREAKAEYYKEFDRKRGDNPDRVQARKDYFEKKRHDPLWQKARRNSRKNWFERNKQRVFANREVSNAIRDGKLKRLPCERCGDKKAEAHHEDYSKPFDVMWLCKNHHMARHKEINAEKRKAA